MTCLVLSRYTGLPVLWPEDVGGKSVTAVARRWAGTFNKVCWIPTLSLRFRTERLCQLHWSTCGVVFSWERNFLERRKAHISSLSVIDVEFLSVLLRALSFSPLALSILSPFPFFFFKFKILFVVSLERCGRIPTLDVPFLFFSLLASLRNLWIYRFCFIHWSSLMSCVDWSSLWNYVDWSSL